MKKADREEIRPFSLSDLSAIAKASFSAFVKTKLLL